MCDGRRGEGYFSFARFSTAARHPCHRADWLQPVCVLLARNGAPVKIVFIIDSLQRHGTQRFLVQLVRVLHDLNYKQSVIALNKVSDPDIDQALSTAGCAITRIGQGALLLGGLGGWRMVAILKRSKPDVVMTMLDFADTLGRPAARLAGCSVLLSSIRARNLAKPSWQRWIERRTI